MTVIPTVISAFGSHQRTGTGRGGFGDKKTCGDDPNHSIYEISQNSKKSPGDLWKFVITQTPVENHQLTMVRKTLK